MYSYFEKLCRKKAQNCTSQFRKVVWVDVLSCCTCCILMRYNNKISANFRSSFFFEAYRNKVRLAPLKFRRIFLTLRDATVKIKLKILAPERKNKFSMCKNKNLANMQN